MKELTPEEKEHLDKAIATKNLKNILDCAYELGAKHQLEATQKEFDESLKTYPEVV